MIYPEIFNGHVLGFFTDRDVGTRVERLTGKKVYFPVQKHTDTVKVVKGDLKSSTADAVITDRDDIFLGIKAADCVPILVFDRANRAMGAIHAGWRGTAKGILRKTIRKMSETFGSSPQELLVAIGPAIRWCCYTVGKDVLDAVKKETGKGDYHIKRKGEICLDLQSANRVQALSEGVDNIRISITEECTYCFPEKYFSYRFEKGTRKRQGGFIGMP
jgi:YfiH family protein